MDAEMEFKGNASLTNRNINILKNVSGGLDLRVEAINHNIGRVYFVDQGGNMQPLPANAQGQPIITMVDRAGTPVVPHNNEFLYIYGDSFVVSVNGVPVMRLDQQKQHSLLAQRQLQHDKIEL
jgi:hypothetical protein